VSTTCSEWVIPVAMTRHREGAYLPRRRVADAPCQPSAASRWHLLLPPPKEGTRRKRVEEFIDFGSEARGGGSAFGPEEGPLNQWFTISGHGLRHLY
jgi:hypothetical protein